MTRAFLLMNLEHPSAHHPHPLKFRIPIDLLGKSISELGSFPYLPGERTWEGPALFIKGEKSKCVICSRQQSEKVFIEHVRRYINKHNIDIAKAFFPNMVLEKLDASHWGKSRSASLLPFYMLILSFEVHSER